MNVTGIAFFFFQPKNVFFPGGGISYVATHHSDEMRSFRGGLTLFFLD